MPVHTPRHASWLNQIEIYFSIVQRKVLTPNDFATLAALEHYLMAFQHRYQMAAQPFRFATPPSSARPTSLAFTKYLVIWETEGSHAQELQDTLVAATKTGEVKVLAVDPTTAQSNWWVTTSPFITKYDFQR